MKGMTNVLLGVIIVIGILMLYMLGALNGLVAGINTYLPPGSQIPIPAPLLPPATPPGEIAPPAGGYSNMQCTTACVSRGYDTGACQTPAEAFATSTNIGACSTSGEWCYCWDEAAAEPEPEPEPESSGIMTWAECEAMGVAEGKDFYHLFETAGSLDACEEWASSYCASRGTWLTRFDWNLGCCIWDCYGL